MTSSGADDSPDEENIVESDVPQPERTLERILATALELFINLTGQPTIVLPAQSAVPGGSQEYPLRSERVRGWIAWFAWEHFQFVPTERQISRILEVLCGKAWHDQRQDTDNHHRAHASRENLPPIRAAPNAVDSLSVDQIVVRSHVGGLVRSFERKAA